MGSYVFKWPYPADDVHVTGTFDDWGKSEQLNKVGDFWAKEVILPSADEKVLYKFVVDDQWIVDESAPKEGDGHNNVNNVLYPEHIKRIEVTSQAPGAFPETPGVDQVFSVAPFPATAGTSNPVKLPAGEKVPGSKELTSNTVASTATTSKEDYEKAGQEPESLSVNPIAASSGTGNPIGLAPGQPIPPGANQNKIESAVTTSKEDYEKAGEEPQSVSVAPIPASSGIGNPVDLAPGQPIPSSIHQNTTESTVTTSKDDYEQAGQEPETVFAKPIPASSGIGNPIDLAPGQPIPSDVNQNSIEAAATTSKEDYEKAGSYTVPAALGAGAAAAGLGGLAAATAFKKPEGKENLIPESSLPIGSSKMDTLDAGPFISSAGPGTSAAELAAKVPLENNKASPFISSAAPGTSAAGLASKVPLEQDKTSPFISSAAPGTSASGLAAAVPLEKGNVDPTISSAAPGTSAAALAGKVPLEQKRQGMIVDPKDVATTSVPETVQNSIGQSHQDPEAAASAEAVKEKTAVESELLSKVKPSEATGEPASAAAQQTSYHGLATAVPQTVEKSMTKAHAAPEAAADSSVVAEKSAVEQELLKKIPSSNEAGEPAPTIAAATSGVAPTATATGTATTAETADTTLADEPAVQMMHQNEAPSGTTAASAATPAPVSTTTGSVHPSDAAAAASGVPTVTNVGTGNVKSTPTPDPISTSSTPSTPAKKKGETSVADSPASTAATDKSKKKHRHRISAFFKKVFD